VNRYIVIVIVAMGVVTYATRVGFFGFAQRFRLNPLLRRLLEYVPLSILAALIFPAVLAPSGRLASPVTNMYVWAAVITSAVLLISRRPWAAIILGVAVMVLFRRLEGA
jgi:branched-subunit amino acid transport protein